MIAQKIPRGVLAAACLLSIFAGHASYAEPPASSDVTVTTVPQRTVVFVGHVGPYWGIANKLQAVRNYMREHHLTGPLLIRYAADPTRAGGSSIAMKIGFVLDGKHTPSAPLGMETWDAEVVATTRAQPGSAGLAAACRTIRAWSRSHDFVPTGPVIELFAESAGSETDRGRAIVQVAVRPAKGEPSEAQDDPSGQEVAPERRPEPTGRKAPALPTKSTVSAKRTRIEGGQKHLTRDPPAAGPATEIKPSPPEGRSRGAGAEAGFVESAPAIRPIPNKRDAPRATTDPDAKSAVPKHDEQEEREETETESLARRLVPPSSDLDSQSRAWLGQMVLRLRAISRGTKRLYSEEGAAIIGLADAVVDRHARLYGQSGRESQSAPRAVGPANSALARSRKELTRDLDRFMAVLGTKSLSISETEMRFKRIINQAAEIAETAALRKQ